METLKAAFSKPLGEGGRICPRVDLPESRGFHRSRGYLPPFDAELAAWSIVWIASHPKNHAAGAAMWLLPRTSGLCGAGGKLSG